MSKTAVLSDVEVEVPSSRNELMEHLEAVLASPQFAPSARCKEFLRYVATQVLEGHADAIKERTIATDVFGKGGEYNPNEESLVRVKASEVRRRLAKYYETSGAESSIKIELPIGSYVPKFRRILADKEPDKEDAPQQMALVETPLVSRRKALALGAGGLAALVGVAGAIQWRRASKSTALQQFWRPVTAQGKPLLIFLPILKVREHPDQRSDRVGLGAANAAIRLVELFAQSGNKYTVRVGNDLVFSDLRRQPAILLGNFLSYWTEELNRDLRFTFQNTHGPTHIVDTKTQQAWYAPDEDRNGYATLDYALVTRVFDSRTGQILIFASGITTFGTQAAVDFLVDSGSFLQLLKQAPDDWTSRNFQALLSTRVIGATAGPPKLVTTYFW